MRTTLQDTRRRICLCKAKEDTGRANLDHAGGDACQGVGDVLRRHGLSFGPYSRNFRASEILRCPSPYYEYPLRFIDI